MFKLKATIKNPLEPCLIPEVGFHPDGSMFGVTYGKPNNEVHIFDTQNLQRRYVLKNPEAKLEDPHGILFTKNHLIVTNVVDRHLPATINVYRLDTLAQTPIHVIQPSFEQPVELHSIAMHDDILAMTCCETPTKQGEVITFKFNDDTGELSLRDRQITCFKDLGDTKGISFNHEGTLLYVTFESDRIHSKFDQLRFRISQFIDRVDKYGFKGYIDLKKESRKRKQATSTLKPQKRSHLHNGIAVLGIDKDGYISTQPKQVIEYKEFARFENIQINENRLILTDTINNQILFYDINEDPNLADPIQILHKHLSLPHGVKLSPNKKILVVSNYGLKTIGKQISWGNWRKKRMDDIVVFEYEDTAM